MPFASDLSTDPSPSESIGIHHSANHYSALAEEEDSNVEVDSPQLFDGTPESDDQETSSAVNSTVNEILSSLLVNVTQAMSKKSGAPKRLSKSGSLVAPSRKPTAPKRPPSKPKHNK